MFCLPKEPRRHPSGQEVKKVGDVAIPDKVEEALRAAAGKATGPEADRVILGCVETLPSELAGSRSINPRSIVSTLREKNYKFLQSDKEGAFVVVHPEQYRLLAVRALIQNFRPADDFQPSKARKKAIEVSESAGLQRLAATLGTQTFFV
ncbi:hypothetical protein HPB52_009317 [Rhipicephalus sanguineus]|uniref:Uncharacterized protein n=1 Tax=Rhipicephalus sanguineus TaxID=34632 RepID=A0A9D4T943_RHISA|nr:hypothetical protein HPB52_009317 [Rhipicephalus sanguineus]